MKKTAISQYDCWKCGPTACHLTRPVLPGQLVATSRTPPVTYTSGMTVPQFKKWLESKIQYLRGLDEFENPDDGPYGLEILEEAYQIAIDLGLPECAKACKPPVTIGLLACLEAIPSSDILSLTEAAKYLGYSVSGLRKIVKRKEIRFAQNGQGPIKFQIDWLDDFLTCHKVERSQAQSRRAPISIQPEHGFDPKLL